MISKSPTFHNSESHWIKYNILIIHQISASLQKFVQNNRKIVDIRLVLNGKGMTEILNGAQRNKAFDGFVRCSWHHACCLRKNERHAFEAFHLYFSHQYIDKLSVTKNCLDASCSKNTPCHQIRNCVDNTANQLLIF